MRNNRSLQKRLSRKLLMESLENRALMAADLYHNFAMPEDVDANGRVTPIDALIAIDRVNRSVAGEPSTATSQLETVMVDVDADESISPLDALAVIDILNSRSANGENGSLVSRIQPDRRIERIERAVEANTLPPGWTMDQAQAILETLRVGGRPELGDIVENGSLRWMPEVISLPYDDGQTSEDEAHQVESFVAAVAQRLEAFNVSTEVISDISRFIREGTSAGTPVDQSQVRERLSKLGVDVDTIMPQPKTDIDLDEPQDPANEQILVTAPILESIVARLSYAGAAGEIIDTISKECSDAIDAGSPLGLEQVQERLGQLGFSWATFSYIVPEVLPPALDPEPPRSPRQEQPDGRIDRPEPPVVEPPIVVTIMVTRPVADSLLPRLAESGVSERILAILSREIYDAIAIDRPLSMLQVRLRLMELGG
jgi:hypothetical protein